jgi:hypothetical protein
VILTQFVHECTLLVVLIQEEEQVIILPPQVTIAG